MADFVLYKFKVAAPKKRKVRMRKRTRKEKITAVRLPDDQRGVLQYIVENSGGRWDISKCVITAIDEWVVKKLPEDVLKKLGYIKAI